MNNNVGKWFEVSVLLFVRVSADYECLCTYKIETRVYAEARENATVLGFMYEFDCRPTAHQAGSLPTQWRVIAFEHQVGYVLVDSQVITQVCPGGPPNSDILTSTASTRTAAIQTTLGSSKASTTAKRTTLTTKSAIKTTHRTARITTRKSTSPSPSAKTTSNTGTSSSFIPASPSSTPNVPGNVQLCPNTLHQYTIEDKGALAQFGDSCYEIVPIRTTWLKGENDCVAKGGHLFHISNQSEQDFILRFINFHQFAHACWMGLHDLIKEEMFEWISGDNVTYTNWWHDRLGNIMSHHQEDCVLFVPYSPYFGQWDDVPCGYTDALGVDQVKINPFICQFSIHKQYSYVPLSHVLGRRQIKEI